MSDTLPERIMQIGVVGSSTDFTDECELSRIVEEVGRWIARSGSILVYMAGDGLAWRAECGARKEGGQILTILDYRWREGLRENNPRAVVKSEAEFVLAATSDSLIALDCSPSTAKLVEIAYNMGKPIVGLKVDGGWCEQYAKNALYTNPTQENQIKVEEAVNPKRAVEIAIERYAPQTYYPVYLNPKNGLNVRLERKK